jgi:membrane protease YdiL (CAAX protease family)
VSRAVWGWSLLAGLLSLAALAGFWIALVELTGAGGNPTIPDNSRYPVLTVVLGLLMGSIVSPTTEEAAFRGYAQVILERVFPAATSIVFSSVLFALWHGPTQAFVWSKLLFYLIVGIVFGTIAYLTNSVWPALPIHVLGDLTFFFLIWPYDATRPLVEQSGADFGFWLSVGQAIIFAGLAVLAFRQLRQSLYSPARPDNLAQFETSP